MRYAMVLVVMALAGCGGAEGGGGEGCWEATPSQNTSRVTWLHARASGDPAWDADVCLAAPGPTRYCLERDQIRDPGTLDQLDATACFDGAHALVNPVFEDDGTVSSYSVNYACGSCEFVEDEAHRPAN